MRNSRRGMILFLVLLVVALSAMIATTAVHTTMAERVNINSAQRRTQARLLAVTGVQSIMHELARQRDDMLAGRIPTVAREGVVFREGLGGQGTERVGLWRVVANKDSEGRERLVIAETAKLDANWATAAMLSTSDALSADDAQNVVGQRSRRRFAATNELVRRGSQIREDRVSVFNADAAEPGGAGGANSKSRSAKDDEPLRVRVDRAWSPDFEEQAKHVLGDELAGHLREMIGKSQGFTTDRDLVNAAASKALKPADIATLLDECLTGGDATGIRLGRVNINQAPLEVLIAIPGFTTQSAQAVVSRRSTLTAELGSHPAWPLTEGLMKLEEFAAAIDWIAVRSLQWRVRIEAGIKIDEGSTTAAENDELRDRIVLEAVIDLADQTPRLAMLRDVTKSGEIEQRDQAAIASEGRAQGDSSKPDDAPPKPSGGRGAKARASDLKIDRGLKLGELAPEPLSVDSSTPDPAPPAPRSGPAPAPPPKPPAPGRVGRWTTGR